MGFRADSTIRAAVVKWAENQPDQPTVSEAVRRLVEVGLSNNKLVKATPAKSAKRAKQLATTTLDRLTDSAASTYETAIRKRRLLKGPSEFRDDRVDASENKQRK
jgi:hypothetical protein